MNALDTNVLIRFLVADDEKQANRVRLLFKRAEADQQKLYVPVLVVLEMLWVLESVYKIPRHQILSRPQKVRPWTFCLTEGENCDFHLPYKSTTCFASH